MESNSDHSLLPNSILKRASSHVGTSETSHFIAKLTTFLSFLEKICGGNDFLQGTTNQQIFDRFFTNTNAEAILRSNLHSTSSSVGNPNILAVYVVPNSQNQVITEVQAILDHYKTPPKPVYLVYPPFTSYDIPSIEQFQAFKRRVSGSNAIDERVIFVSKLDQPFHRLQRTTILQLLLELCQLYKDGKKVKIVTSAEERKRIRLQVFHDGHLRHFTTTLTRYLETKLEQLFPPDSETSDPVEEMLRQEKEQIHRLFLQTILNYITSNLIIQEHCHARAGLMGNPSDGFNGCTLSFLIKNFAATVILVGNEADNDYRVELKESNEYDDILRFQRQSQVIGYNSGGLRLVQATCKVFFRSCKNVGIDLYNRKGFALTFSTTIPRMVGLSGSSAIIVATFRSLLRYYKLTIDDLRIEKETFPEVILNIEKEELGISAGLQDRVIQTYGGLVHMDFTRSETKARNIYRELSPELLPPLYLIYNTAAGGDSGKVHSTVKERWAVKDPILIEGMQTIGSLANEAVTCLENRDYVKLGELMEKNFQMRRKLYSDAVVGISNIQIAELVKDWGLAVKFTGSGGAFIGIRRDGQGWFDREQEEIIREKLRDFHFEFVRIEIP